jgi:hypothetical protein
MSTNTSIGPGTGQDGNEGHGNADGCGNKTLGDRAAPDVPAGVPGAKPEPGIRKGPNSYSDGPNVETSAGELDAARGKLPAKDK